MGWRDMPFNSFTFELGLALEEPAHAEDQRVFAATRLVGRDEAVEELCGQQLVVLTAEQFEALRVGAVLAVRVQEEYTLLVGLQEAR